MIPHASFIPREPTIRKLIIELAQVETAMQATPTFTTTLDLEPAFNPQLQELVARERDIVRILRSHHDRGWSPPVPDQFLSTGAPGQ